MCEKIALFDFCETLVNFQTADAFVRYAYKNINNKELSCSNLVDGLLSFLDGITGYRFSLHKRYLLRNLRGVSADQIAECACSYYNTIVKRNFIPEMLNVLRKCLSEGFSIVLISGGYDVYLKLFADEFHLKTIIATKIQYKNNICTGRIDGKDCLAHNKVALLNKLYNRNDIYAVAYSDSITDKPLLEWANIGYVISKNNSQVWARDYNFKEIIWEEKSN